MIKKSSWVEFSILYWVTFISFFGFYVCLLLMSNLGMMDLTRVITIPLRIFICGGLCLLFVLGKRTGWDLNSKLFVLFSMFYLLRIFIDHFELNRYQISTGQLFLYYISFAIVPFLIVNGLNFGERHFKTIRNSVLFSGLLFTLLSTLFFQKYVGTIGRLTSSLVGEEVLSPLVLSYCSALAIGIAVSQILDVKNKSTFSRVFPYVLIALSIFPFFLGASRGSVIALFLPLFCSFIAKSDFVSSAKMIIFGVITLIGLLYFSEKFGSSVINRILSISSDVESGKSSAVRTEIWPQALDQFADHPFLGDKFKIDGFDGYSHNLIVEVLLTTGVFGFIPFALLMYNGFRASMRIFKYNPEFSWISIIFIQSFAKHMFSGAAYNANWLWFSLALVFVFDQYIKRQAQKEKLNIKFVHKDHVL